MERVSNFNFRPGIFFVVQVFLYRFEIGQSQTLLLLLEFIFGDFGGNQSLVPAIVILPCNKSQTDEDDNN